jgi:molybdopterin molybdotransferase
MATTDRDAAPYTNDPRMRGFRTRSLVEDVHTLIDERVTCLGVERISLWRAAGRVLGEAVEASVDVPGFDRAAMDGYALRGEETFGADIYTPASFRVIGRARPGAAFEGVVNSGEAVEIATGAPLPRGADAVARVEGTRRAGETALVTEATPPTRHVSRRGEDVEGGSIVFEAGRVLRPQDLGVLSVLGRSEVTVVRRPSVVVIVTGRELLPAGSPPDEACFADMNGVMLAALIERDGGSAEVVGPIPDHRESIRETLAPQIRCGDAVFVSGASSTGPEDHVPELVSELGSLDIHGVALRPASPTGLGFVDGVPVLLLPGNPVSCLCAYDFFGGRIVRALGGCRREWAYRKRNGVLREKLVSALGRVDYARVVIDSDGVLPLAVSGASILSSTTRADGFVVVPANLEGYTAGTEVTVWLYDL